MTIESTVIAWVTLPNSEAYYANGQSGGGPYPQNAQRMVEDALNLVDPLVDFGQFDANHDGYIDSITIIHSGYGAEWGGGGGNWIWSHKWALPTPWTSRHQNAEGVNVKVSRYHTEPALWGMSGTAITRIGVICHEIGHAFGLLDLYDTDPSKSSGIGSYCLMANAWGFDGSQLHPPHMGAWCKMKLGWVVPTIIRPGSYNAPQVESRSTVFRIENGYPSGEYLLIENRQPTGFEYDMPQGGLAIGHIDESKTNNNTEGYPGQTGWPRNGNHYMVALLQADGQYNLEHGANRGDFGDLYRGTDVSLIGPDTKPNTDSYQSGNVRRTGKIISGISFASSVMSFVFSAPSPLRLGSLQRLPDGAYRIWIGTADGTAIDPTRIPAIDLYASSDVSQPMAGWTRLTGRLTATNGLLWLDDPAARTLPTRKLARQRRWYRSRRYRPVRIFLTGMSGHHWAAAFSFL